jgi:hypothetical protein
MDKTHDHSVTPEMRGNDRGQTCILRFGLPLCGRDSGFGLSESGCRMAGTRRNDVLAREPGSNLYPLQ